MSDSYIEMSHQYIVFKFIHRDITFLYRYVTFLYRKSEYDQKIPQQHTADRPKAPRGRATEHKQSQDISNTIQKKQINQLSFSIKMITKLERTLKLHNKKMTKYRAPTMGATINNESTPAEQPP